jgi:hypothetical protein
MFHSRLIQMTITIVALGAGCRLETSGLGPGIKPGSQQPNAYSCGCACTILNGIGGGSIPIPVPSDVCVPENLNPNLHVRVLTDADVAGDCGGRVKLFYEDMLRNCYLGNSPLCECGPTSAAFFDQACDDTCESLPAEPACANFNEENGFVATLPPEAPDGAAPLCLVPQGAEFAQGQLPEASPAPFSEHFTGRRSTCQLIAAQSTTTIDVNGEQVAPTTTGQVQFLGEPCPAGRCAVGMSYKLDIDPFELGSFFGGTEFNDLVASGAAIQGAAELDEQGVGQIAAGSTLTSGRGTRRDFGVFGSEPDKQMSFEGTNDQPVEVSVDWINKTCAVNGVLLGASVEEGNSLNVAVSLHGTLVNQPPLARAGAAQTVECTSAEGAVVSLDGGASSDPDTNVALAQWQRQSRLGPIVSESLTASLTQPLGAETYVLRVMDAFGQIDEDTTVVTVVDSTPPDVTSITADPKVLSPANHTLVPVTVSVAASDSCGGQSACHITAIQSNEPANGGGDGNTSADFIVTGPLTAFLRAERSGSGTSRVYTLFVECTDPAGNSVPVTTTVTVPH